MNSSFTLPYCTVEQIRKVFDDNFRQFSIKMYVVGTH